MAFWSASHQLDLRRATTTTDRERQPSLDDVGPYRPAAYLADRPAVPLPERRHVPPFLQQHSEGLHLGRSGITSRVATTEEDGPAIQNYTAFDISSFVTRRNTFFDDGQFDIPTKATTDGPVPPQLDKSQIDAAMGALTKRFGSLQVAADMRTGIIPTAAAADLPQDLLEKSHKAIVELERYKVAITELPKQFDDLMTSTIPPFTMQVLNKIGAQTSDTVYSETPSGVVRTKLQEKGIADLLLKLDKKKFPLNPFDLIEKSPGMTPEFLEAIRRLPSIFCREAYLQPYLCRRQIVWKIPITPLSLNEILRLLRRIGGEELLIQRKNDFITCSYLAYQCGDTAIQLHVVLYCFKAGGLEEQDVEFVSYFYVLVRFNPEALEDLGRIYK